MPATYQALIEQLSRSGSLPPAWRAAFAAVPRELFIRDTVWRPTEDGLLPLIRDDEPDTWHDLVYADEFVVTQADDELTAPGEIGSYITSSCSKPSIVALMLDRLQIRPHHRVLEIGTGSGWNAGILAARLGDEQVASIEIDPAIANGARKALASAGFTPTIVTGDGALGYPAGAPYDRIISTASVRRVPYPWVRQTRPGGRIVTPWGTPYDNGMLLALTVHDDGTATGCFIDNSISFMWLRAHRTPYGAVEDRVLPEHRYTEKISRLHPWEPIGDRNGAFAIGLRVPNCQIIVVADDDGQDNHFVAYLMDPVGGSWASAHVEPHMIDQVPVRQHGPRRLWDEIEAAHVWWDSAGKPDYRRFGVTVRQDAQRVWLDAPERLVSATG